MSDSIIQPALIIGTGGSGIEVLRRFKRRFREVYPDTPYVQLLGIDTAPQEQLGREAPILSPDEFLYASDFNMDFFVGPEFIDRNPAIRTWWRGYENLPMRTIKAGAGQKRPVGRLALFVKYDELVTRIREQVQRIFNSKVFGELPKEYRRSINLYIVSSTCGGTGTGQFIDLAYIASKSIKTVSPGISVNSRGLFFLPSAFLETQQVPPQNGPRLQANAFGALTELDYLMHPGVEPAEVAYSESVTIGRSDPPFRSVYLVGNQSADGKLYTDFHEIMERSSVHVMVELASPLTSEGDARMDNALTAIAAKGEISGRGRSYSSFGEEWLELPTARLRVKWQKLLGRRIFDRLIGEGDPIEGSPVALDDSGAYGKLRSIRTTAGLAAFMPRLESERAIFTDIGQDGLDPSEILANANTLQRAAAAHLSSVESEVGKVIEESAKEAKEELLAVAGQILRGGRLSDLTALCASADRELRDWLSQSKSHGQGGREGSWTNELGHALGGVKTGLFTGAKRAADAQRQLVLEAERNAEEEWKGRLKGFVGEMFQVHLRELLHDVSRLKDRAQKLANYLPAARTMIRQRDEPVMPPGVDMGALSDEEIDSAFDEDDRAERLEDEAGPFLTELLDLSEVSVESVEDKVWTATGSAVMTMAGEFLKNISIPSDEVARRLAQLQPLAVYEPAWSANPERRHVERLRILGIPEQSMGRRDEILGSLPPEIRAETQCVGHADPDRVIMTVQDHGFPLFALDEASHLRSVFEQLQPGEQNLCFVLPEATARHWTYTPEGAGEARKLFGLALVLGIIKQVGPRWVFNAGGSGSIDTPLGKGGDAGESLQEAFDTFLREGFATRVRAVLRRAEEEDTPGLHQRCEEWVAEKRSSELPRVMEEVVQRVEAYTRSIRPF